MEKSKRILIVLIILLIVMAVMVAILINTNKKQEVSSAIIHKHQLQMSKMNLLER